MRPVVVPTLLIALISGCVHRIEYAEVKVKHPQTVTLVKSGETTTTIVGVANAPIEETAPFPDDKAAFAQRHADGSLDLILQSKWGPEIFSLVDADGTVHHTSFGWGMRSMGTMLASDLPKARSEMFRVAIFHPGIPNLVFATPWENLETVTIHSEPPRWIGVLELVVGTALLFAGGYYFADGIKHDNEGHHREVGVGFAMGGSIFLGSGLWMLATPSEEYPWSPPR